MCLIEKVTQCLGLLYTTPQSKSDEDEMIKWLPNSESNQNLLFLDENIWIGNHQSQGQAKWFTCDFTNRSKIPWNRYNYITVVFSLYLRGNNTALVFFHMMKLSTLSIKYTTSLMGLFHLNAVRTRRDFYGFDLVLWTDCWSIYSCQCSDCKSHYCRPLILSTVHCPISHYLIPKAFDLWWSIILDRGHTLYHFCLSCCKDYVFRKNFSRNWKILLRRAKDKKWTVFCEAFLCKFQVG